MTNEIYRRRGKQAGLPDFSWYIIPKRGKYTKLPQNIPTAHRIFQMPVKRPNVHKIYRHLQLQDPPKLTQFGIFG
jgi:hypothetical protein